MSRHKRKYEQQERHPARYLDNGQVQAYLGVSRSTLYSWISKESFPPAVALGPRTIRWRLEDIQDWEATRETA